MIVYTAIFNDYDVLRDVFLPPGWRAVCFSDRPISSKTWEVIVIPGKEKEFRRVKIMPYEYLPRERTIWIDGNLQPNGRWERLDRPGIWVMEHPERASVHEEAAACIYLRKDSADRVIEQVKRYENCELVATGVMVREPESYTDDFAGAWWSEVERFSHRDQLSFTPMAKLYDIQYKKMPFLEGFYKHKHIKKRLAW